MKKKNLKKWIGISLVLSMLMSLVIPVSAASISPEWEKILKSLTVTDNNLQKAYEENESQVTKLIQGILEKPYELNMSGELVNIKSKDIESSQAEVLKGFGVQLSKKNDSTANTYLLQGNLNKNRDIIVSGIVFISDQLIAVNSKELIGNTYLGVNPSTLYEDMKKSIWAKEFQNVIDEGIDINTFIEAQKPRFKKEEELAVLMSKYTVIGKDTVMSNDAKKTGAVTLELKNGKVNCDEYTITLKKEWIHSYIDKLAVTLKNDKELQDWIVQQSGYKASSKLSDELKKELVTGIDELAKECKNVVTQNVLIKIYINERNEINKLAFETKISNETDKSDDTGIYGEITLGDGKSLAEEIKAILKLTNGKKEYASISYDMEQTKINSETTIVHEFKVITEGEDIITIAAKADYDETKTQDNVNLTLAIQADDFNIGANATGDLAVDTNNASVKANFDGIKLTMVDGQDDFELQLKGNILLSQIDTKDININGSNVKMVLKMSEEELKALSAQTEANAYLLEMKMAELFKSKSKYQGK